MKNNIHEIISDEELDSIKEFFGITLDYLESNSDGFCAVDHEIVDSYKILSNYYLTLDYDKIIVLKKLNDNYYFVSSK